MAIAAVVVEGNSIYFGLNGIKFAFIIYIFTNFIIVELVIVNRL